MLTFNLKLHQEPTNSSLNLIGEHIFKNYPLKLRFYILTVSAKSFGKMYTMNL